MHIEDVIRHINC